MVQSLPSPFCVSLNARLALVTLALVASASCCGAAKSTASRMQGLRYRHQFEYVLNPGFNDSASVELVLAVLTNVTEQAPTAAAPLQVYMGGDLGIAASFSTVNYNTQGSLAGTFEFATQESMHAFFAFLTAFPAWLAVSKTYIKTAARVQYLAPHVPAKKNTVRTAYMYNFSSVPNATSIATILAKQTDLCILCPAEFAPSACVGGADLSLHNTLYPALGPNLWYAGTNDWDNVTKLESFFFWVKTTDFKNVVGPLLAAGGTSYVTHYKPAAHH